MVAAANETIVSTVQGGKVSVILDGRRQRKMLVYEGPIKILSALDRCLVTTKEEPLSLEKGAFGHTDVGVVNRLAQLGVI